MRVVLSVLSACNHVKSYPRPILPNRCAQATIGRMPGWAPARPVLFRQKRDDPMRENNDANGERRHPNNLQHELPMRRISVCEGS
jgi:hypothetical protein